MLLYARDVSMVMLHPLKIIQSSQILAKGIQQNGIPFELRIISHVSVGDILRMSARVYDTVHYVAHHQVFLRAEWWVSRRMRPAFLASCPGSLEKKRPPFARVRLRRPPLLTEATLG